MTRPLHATHHCRHYSYNRSGEWPIGKDGGPTCAVGIDLSEGGAAMKTCMPQSPNKCPKREEYTDEERIVWEHYRTDGTNRMLAAIGALPRPIPMRSSGKTECPNCAGELHYGRWKGGAMIECKAPDCVMVRFNIKGEEPWPPPGEGD